MCYQRREGKRHDSSGEVFVRFQPNEPPPHHHPLAGACLAQAALGARKRREVGPLEEALLAVRVETLCIRR